MIHNGFPSLGTQQMSENLQEISLWRPVRFDCRNSPGLGKTDSWGPKQDLVHTRTWEKGAVTPQQTEPDLPVCAWESPAEVWVDSGLLWDTIVLEAPGCVSISPFEGGCQYPYHSLAFVQTTGKDHSPAHQQKI